MANRLILLCAGPTAASSGVAFPADEGLDLAGGAGRGDPRASLGGEASERQRRLAAELAAIAATLGRIGIAGDPAAEASGGCPARHGRAGQGRAGREAAAAAHSARGPRPGALPTAWRLVASPDRAARETAAALGLAVAVEPALAGLALGRWAGRRLAEIAAAEPEALARWVGEGAPAPGGESRDAFARRVTLWLEARKAAGSILAVVPVATAAVAVAAVLSAPPTAAGAVALAALGAVEFTSDGRRWAIRRLGPARRIL